MSLKKTSILVYIIVIFSIESTAQPANFIHYGDLYEQGSSKIELWIKTPKNSCGINAKKFKYILMPRNISNSSIRNTPFISWKIDVVNCDGYLISKFWCEDISEFLTQSDDSPWEKKDFDFDADSIESPVHSISINSFQVSGKDMNLGVKEKLLPPNSIIGATNVMKYETVNLSVDGGNLSKGANWFWYKDVCSQGSFFATGRSVTVKPDKTTKYFVRGEIGAKKTICTEVTVVVDNNSITPLSIVPENGDIICDGSDLGKKLSVNGGKLGYKAQWVWYENSISSENERHKGASFVVSPLKTTTYYVRAESDSSNNSSAVEFTVRVVNKSIPPTSILISKTGMICEDDLLEFKVVGGKLGESSEWYWEKKSQFGTAVKLDKGEFISDKATENSVYTVYASGACETRPAYSISLKVDVSLKSVSPPASSISVIKEKRRNVVTVPEESGILGTGAKWVWYKNELASEVVSTGKEFYSKSVDDKKFYLRAEGDCNTSDLISVSVSGLGKKRFTFINAGLTLSGSGFDPNRISNLQVSIGRQGFYVKATLAVPSLYGNKADDISNPTFEYDGNRITNYPYNSGTFYKFNEKIYSNLRLYNIGIMTGKKGVKLYFGAGYGIYDLYWGVDTYKYGTNILNSVRWARYPSKSLSGPSVEGGLFLKIGPLNFMGGINGVYSFQKSQQLISGQLGAGLTF